MKSRYSWLILVAGLVLCFGLAGSHVACSCGDDDDDDDDHLAVLSPSECDALITQIYDVCQQDVNEWVRDMALEYCNGGGSADWVCINSCAQQFPNDCSSIFTCSVDHCS